MGKFYSPYHDGAEVPFGDDVAPKRLSVWWPKRLRHLVGQIERRGLRPLWAWYAESGGLLDQGVLILAWATESGRRALFAGSLGRCGWHDDWATKEVVLEDEPQWGRCLACGERRHVRERSVVGPYQAARGRWIAHRLCAPCLCDLPPADADG